VREAAPEDRAHPVFARVWSRVGALVGSDARRRALLAGLSGRVLEVGAGDGRNFAHYPSRVARVVAVEPEPYLRALATEAAQAAPVAIDVLAGWAEALPVDDAGFDAAVASLVLCTVSDQAAALAELRRVLKPGGELRFFEHVVAAHDPGAGLQRALDRTGVWPGLAGGCHLARDTVGAIAAAGFTVEAVERFPSGPGRFGVPFVLGRARLAG
jgi:SAM-dependent methyltransferase